MLPQTLLNIKVSIKRRVSQGRDSLGNPIYGQPTEGAGWKVVYVNMPVRLAFTDKGAKFAQEGERIMPTGTMYFNTANVLKMEDRVLTPDGIEYNVINIATAYIIGDVIDHYEAILQLP